MKDPLVTRLHDMREFSGFKGLMVISSMKDGKGISIKKYDIEGVVFSVGPSGVRFVRLAIKGIQFQ